MKRHWIGLIVGLAVLGSPSLADEPRQQGSTENQPAVADGQAPAKKKENGERPLMRRQRPGQVGQPGQFLQDAGERGLGERGPQRDMGQMVALMIRQFDVDGDEKLDSEELTKMLTALRQRQGMGGFFQADRPQQRPGGGGKSRWPSNDVSDEAGGVTPQRPPKK